MRSVDLFSEWKCNLTPAPTSAPTSAPITLAPTFAPVTAAPTLAPVTAAPTLAPVTAAPTSAPTAAPTSAPTLAPVTAAPTSAPTAAPTSAPTAAPTSAPTAAPTSAPITIAPTLAPVTAAPTLAPVTAAPTSAPTSAPLDICSEELSKMCFTNLNIPGLVTDKFKRLCPSTCTTSNPGGCDKNLDVSYTSLKGLLGNSTNGVTGSVIKSTSNMKDYVTLYNLTSAQGNKGEVNCWLNCMDTAKCIGFKWDSSSSMCTLYSSMIIGQTAKQSTETIQWMCGNAATGGQQCSYDNMITKLSSGASGPIGTYAFQPDPNCSVYNCEGQLYNDLEVTAAPTTPPPTVAPTFAPTASPTAAPTAAPTQPIQWDTFSTTECMSNFGVNDGSVKDPNRSLLLDVIPGIVDSNTCKQMCRNAGVICTGYQTNKNSTECILWKVPITYRPSNFNYDCTKKLYDEVSYGQTSQNTSSMCYLATGIVSANQKAIVCSSSTYYNIPITITNGFLSMAADYSAYDVKTLSNSQSMDSVWYLIPATGQNDGLYYIQHALSGFRIWGNVNDDLTIGSFKCTNTGYPGAQNVVEMFTILQNSDGNGTCTFVPSLTCTGCSKYANTALSITSGGIGLQPQSTASKWNVNLTLSPIYGFGYMSTNTTLMYYSNQGGGDTVQFYQMIKNGISISNNCLVLQTNKVYHIMCGLDTILANSCTFGFTVESPDQYNKKNLTVGMPGSSIYLNPPGNSRSETSKNVTSFIYDTRNKLGTDLLVRMSCTAKGDTGDLTIYANRSYIMATELSPFYQYAQLSLKDDGSGYQTITSTQTLVNFTNVMVNNNLLVTYYFPYATLSTNCIYLIQCSVQGNVPDLAQFELGNKIGTVLPYSQMLYLRNASTRGNVINTGTLTYIYNTSGLSGNDLFIGLYLTGVDSAFPVKVSKYSEMTITQIDGSTVYQIYNVSGTKVNNAGFVRFNLGSKGNGGLGYQIVNSVLYAKLLQNKTYKIIYTIGTNYALGAGRFQLCTANGTNIGTEVYITNQDSETGNETCATVYSTWGKTGDSLLIGVKCTLAIASIQINPSQCSFTVIEMQNLSKNPTLNPPTTIAPPDPPPSVVNGVNITQDLYLVNYLNYNKLTYNSTNGNLDVTTTYSPGVIPSNTRFRFVPIIGNEYNLINSTTGERVYIDSLTDIIVWGNQSPASTDVIDRFILTTYTLNNLQFVSIKASMSICTAPYCLNNKDTYLLVNSNNKATFEIKKEGLPPYSYFWFIESTTAIAQTCNLYGISLCGSSGVKLVAVVNGSLYNITNYFSNNVQRGVMNVDMNKYSESTTTFTFQQSDINGWLFMYVGGTRAYLRYDASYNHLAISNDNYLNQLYYFRIVPYGQIDGTFGLETRAGKDCAVYCGNKYLRRFTGVSTIGSNPIDGTTDASEMLLFRIM